MKLTFKQRNINIPWPTKGMGDADYIFAFQQVVMPIAFEFNPDLVMSKSGKPAGETHLSPYQTNITTKSRRRF